MSIFDAFLFKTAINNTNNNYIFKKYSMIVLLTLVLGGKKSVYSGAVLSLLGKFRLAGGGNSKGGGNNN